MKLICLGCGGALGQYNNTNFLIGDGSYLAVDVGQTWPRAMRESSCRVEDVDAVYVSHLHADHCGGMEFLGFYTYFKMGFPFGKHRPKLYGMWEVIYNMWEHTLKGGMESIQNQRNTLETFFDPYQIPPNGKFEWGGTTFELIQTVHVVDDRRIVPSAGLRFVSPDTGKRVFITGDTQFCPNQIMSYYQTSDIIFQDCEMLKYPGSVHAQYHELKTLPDEIKAKMYLTHHDTPGFLFKEDGFLGFTFEGQEIDV